MPVLAALPAPADGHVTELSQATPAVAQHKDIAALAAVRVVPLHAARNVNSFSAIVQMHSIFVAFMFALHEQYNALYNPTLTCL